MKAVASLNHAWCHIKNKAKASLSTRKITSHNKADKEHYINHNSKKQIMHSSPLKLPAVQQKRSKTRVINTNSIFKEMQKMNKVHKFNCKYTSGPSKWSLQQDFSKHYLNSLVAEATNPLHHLLHHHNLLLLHLLISRHVLSSFPNISKVQTPLLLTLRIQSIKK